MTKFMTNFYTNSACIPQNTFVINLVIRGIKIATNLGNTRICGNRGNRIRTCSVPQKTTVNMRVTGPYDKIHDKIPEAIFAC